MSEAARSRRDDARRDPPLARDGAAPDPLAELARLVGQEDPFRRVFQPQAAMRPREMPSPEVRHADVARHGEDAAFSGAHGVGSDRGGHDVVDHDRYDDRYGTYADADQGHDVDHHGYQDDVHHGHHDDAHHDYYDDGDHGHHDGAPQHHADDRYLAHDDQYYAAEQVAHRDEAGFADERLEPAYPSAAALPDAWAAGAAPDVERGTAPVALGRASSARRPVLVLAAVLALTGGGLAASFLAKGAGSANVASSGSSRGAPTIMAASGPTKVKVEDSSATAPEDQDAALLNKGASASSGPVKIVSSEEQPADLGQLPRSDLADGARPLPAPAPSPFPEPKRVKTFVVHPDGTMLSADATAPAAADAVPATPKTPRGGATPRSAASTPATESTGAVPPAAAPAGATIASLSADPALAGPAASTSTAGAARQAASPGARAGGYGLQLASSPVEADANAAFAKLKKKFPAELGSLTATVHKADTGDKPVYRVRVGSMGQDEAKALCAKLQGAGGSCFVVHN